MNHLWVLYDPTKETQSEKLTTEEAQFILLRLKTKLINDFLIWREDWPKWKKLNVFLDSPDSPFMNLIPLGVAEEKKSPEKTPLKMSPADNTTREKVKSSFEFSGVKIKEVNMNEVFGNTSQQFDGDQFSADQGGFEGFDAQTPANNANVNFNFKSLNKVNAFSKRNNEDKYKIELLLINPKGGMFRTTATDISLTGTFCEKIVPSEFHNGNFELIIINNVISDDDYKRLTLKGQIVVTDSRTYIKYVNPTEEQKNALRAGLDYYVRAMKKISQP